MKYTCVLLLSILSFAVKAQDWHFLYDGKAPGNLVDTSAADPLKDLTHPALMVFEAAKEKATGTGLLIFPGGGYGGLSWEGEGINIAKAFNEKGVTCFVVKYRLPNPRFYAHTDGIPLMDAVAAMRWVKQRATHYRLDTTRIGCIGFSAGGHLAGSFGNLAPDDAKPKFSMLVYPVVTMQQPYTHMGSRENLLGKNPSQDMVDHYSNEMQVSDQTPPTYITHTGDDGLVPVQNGIMLYEALQRHQINSELHLYPKGNHGFIFGIPVKQWQEPMLEWMERSGFWEPEIDGKGKTVVLTFDDAPQSHYSVVPDMLRKYHFGATFYVCEFPPDFQDSTKNMNWRQIQALSKMGYEIGNHMWHHTGVQGLSDSARENEISYVEKKCKELGIPKPVSFCYPGYGTDSAFLPTLKKHGYTTARTGGDKPWEPKKDHPYYVPAYTINGNNPGYFFNALRSATKDNVIVFCVHGVPDISHPWVTTPPEVFEKYLKYLSGHGFKVTSMKAYLKSGAFNQVNN